MSSPPYELTSEVTSPPPGVLWRDVFGNRGFLLCVVLLILFAGIYHYWLQANGQVLVKEAIDLRQDMAKLDKTKLAPYSFLQATTIQQDVLNALGTDQYIQWALHDPRPDKARHPESIIQLFVTYYTGTPDRVPHVPDKCYVASGFDLQHSEIVQIPLPALGEDKVIEAKLIRFEHDSFLGREHRYVMYTFNVNGVFRCTRQGVQARVTEPGSTYAYFSKVELSFGGADAATTREGAIEAGTEFMQVLLPVLVKEHWPDWEAAEAAAHQASPDEPEDQDTSKAETTAQS